MSTKERILQAATDPVEGRILSAQILAAKKAGVNPVLTISGQEMKLRRITEVKIETKGR